MLCCEKCGVTLSGEHRRCPLCQGDLAGTATQGVFPTVVSIGRRHRLLFRMLIFVSLLVGVVCVTVNLAYRAGGWWSLFVVAGIASIWLTLAVVIYKRANILKNILWQLGLISILAVVWDWSTGMRLWSLNFVLPILCSCAMGATAVLARVLQRQIQDYILYLILDSILGIVPLVLILLDVVTVVLPSAICVGISLSCLGALLVFEGRALRDEMFRRFHL